MQSNVSPDYQHVKHDFIKIKCILMLWYEQCVVHVLCFQNIFILFFSYENTLVCCLKRYFAIIFSTDFICVQNMYVFVGNDFNHMWINAQNLHYILNDSDFPLHVIMPAFFIALSCMNKNSLKFEFASSRCFIWS